MKNLKAVLHDPRENEQTGRPSKVKPHGDVARYTTTATMETAKPRRLFFIHRFRGNNSSFYEEGKFDKLFTML